MSATPGVVKAANQIWEIFCNPVTGGIYLRNPPPKEEFAEIIDRETHAPEMVAFIEQVALWRFGTIKELQKEASTLLKKVREP